MAIGGGRGYNNDGNQGGGYGNQGGYNNQGGQGGYNNQGGQGGYGNQGGYNNQGGEGGYSQTGGAQYNRPHHQQDYDSNQGPPGEYMHTNESNITGLMCASVDDDEVVKHAANHSDGAGDSSLFSSAMGFLNNNKVEDEIHRFNNFNTYLACIS